MTKDLYNSFKPMLTPKQMLKKGIFGGTYFNQLVDYRKFPKDWFSELDEIYFVRGELGAEVEIVHFKK